MITIRAFVSSDLPEIVALLRAELPGHTISERDFVRKVLLDTNFDPEGALVSRDSDGCLSGFLLSITRNADSGDGVTDSHRGWITLFAVRSDFRRRSIGSQMFDRGESLLRSQGVSEIWISPYTPHYWTPGVDEAAYPGAIAFLNKRGYEVTSRPLSMAAELGEFWSVPEWAEQRERALSESFELNIEPISPSAVLPLIRFLDVEFPGDWPRHLRESISAIYSGYRQVADVHVAVSKGAVCGFSHSEGDRFGPFGVAEAQRGLGVGAVLLYRALESMYRRGSRRAWFMWTGDGPAKRVYAPTGFVETNRYSIMVKKLK